MRGWSVTSTIYVFTVHVIDNNRSKVHSRDLCVLYTVCNDVYMCVAPYYHVPLYQLCTSSMQ